MTAPYYQDDLVTLYLGDCLEQARNLPNGSAQTIVTSPPYFGLRDYGVAGQLGAESSVGEYVANMVALFSELRRVLADDGTLWLNLGDSFHASQGLLGVPWQVALALRSDGWFIRSDVIWNKPKVMPESIKNRPTRCHEHIFMLAKANSGYLYNHDAVREPAAQESAARYESSFGGAKNEGLRKAGIRIAVAGSREFDGFRALRDVWTISPASFSGAHFAVYPP
jgi:DNA modification methylase